MKDDNGHPMAGEDGSEPALAEVERVAAESDQGLSDTDQSLSDADQGTAEQDQAQSDADQVASDRDQAAADRELAIHWSEELRVAHATSHAERTRSSAERLTGTGLRAVSMFERARTATKRDELAELRDMQAKIRDRTAELRDQASEEHEAGLHRVAGYATTARATAAADRVLAAEDRARAAEDRKRAAEDREHALAELEKAQLDDLTGFYRPGLGYAILQREIDRSRRTAASLVFAFCDVDRLKRVNDDHGHAAGDDLLFAVAKAMRSRLRSYDPVVRVGGDEFVCALPGVDLNQAALIFRDVQRTLTMAQADSSISFGLAALEPDDTLSTLMRRSDHALREAKTQGE